jgi:hypothetical protein
MFKHFGSFNKKKVILIAHNSSGFDSYALIKSHFKLKTPPIILSRNILNVQLQNPHTDAKIKEKWRIEQNKINKNKGWETLKKENSPLQKIICRCSYQHVKSSLDRWGKDFKIPKSIQKTKLQHKDIFLSNFLEKESDWLPYLKNDILSLAACVTKFNKIMMELVKQNMQSCLTAPSLTFKGWFSEINEERSDNGVSQIHSHTDVFTRNFIRRAVKGGRVSANIQKFESKILSELTLILNNHLKHLSFLFDNNIVLNNEPIERDSLIELMKIYSCLGKQNLDINVPKSSDMLNNEQEYKNSISKEIKESLKVDDLLMAFDATSLYPSAMYDENSEYPKAESARPFN